MTPSPLTLRRVETRCDRRRFLALPAAIYAHDPHWVRPLTLERTEHLDPRKNPFFEHAECAFWLAFRDGRPVGRISAQIDRAHLALHGDGTGHFGFLEAEDDAALFRFLLGAAEGWLHERGLKRITGPFSLSINDESGLLIEGFEHPPYVMMGHARPYYARHVEAAGYRKIKDLIAYLYAFDREFPRPAQNLLRKALEEPELRFRSLDWHRYDDELHRLVDIFNDAWSRNWGFVPFSPAEVGHLAKSLKPLLHARDVCIAELRGEPVAMAVTIPNLNEAIADFDGRLLPFNWLRLLWRLKVRRIGTMRMPLMGVRRRFHGTPLGAALALGVIDRLRRDHAAIGTRAAELSWILEDNEPMRRLIETVGGRAYKTYRLYAKDLGQ